MITKVGHRGRIKNDHQTRVSFEVLRLMGDSSIKGGLN